MVSTSLRPRHIQIVLDHIGVAVIRMEAAPLVRVVEEVRDRTGTALDRIDRREEVPVRM
jgi:hypothetical protein